jgi:hypothetical protein
MIIAASSSGGRAFSVVGLRSLACWDCGFESRWGAWMSVCGECCVLSSRGLCVGLITRPEESYRVRCVYVSVIVKPWQWGGPGSLGAVAPWKKKTFSLQALRAKTFSHSLLISYELYVHPQHPPSYYHRSNMWYLDNLGIFEKCYIKIYLRWDRWAWTGCVWLRIRRSGRLLLFCCTQGTSSLLWRNRTATSPTVVLDLLPRQICVGAHVH